MGEACSGIINLYKEKGYTSFDAVARVRKILGTKKVGHTGTLDPDAEGVLPVCVGSATKACSLLTDRDKEYEAVMLLGVETDTQDATGTVVRECDPALLASVTERGVREAAERFVGEIMQVPPMYSALKVGGRRLCDLAREGVEVERKPRPIRIFSLEVTSIELPRVSFRARCSKGTYIRTLCADIGEALGCGACMESLLRTMSAGFRVEDSLRISEVERLAAEEGEKGDGGQPAYSFLIPVDEVFSGYPRAAASGAFAKALYNGNPLSPEMLLGYDPAWEEGLLRVYDEEGRFVGIYRHDAGRYRPEKMFL